MFKFLKDDGVDDRTRETDKTATDDAYQLNTFQDHLIEERHYTIARQIPTSTTAYESISTGSGSIKYINLHELLNSKFVENDTVVSKISNSASDLISGVYEGGFKIWECTFDLMKMIQNTSFTNTQVLDLGCGSGLLGLSALCRGAATVHFHDYNPEVLNFLTIPNVILNHNDENVSRCRFMSGDWTTFNRHIQESPSEIQQHFQYDYILSSETVYNVQYLPALCSLIKTCLKPNGTMLLAAKTCYFGVGGGTKAFQSVVESDGIMESQAVQVFRTGVQREIISVKWKS